MLAYMNHLPSSIRAAMPKFPVDGTEAEQDAWFEALGPAPGIKHVDDQDDDDEFDDIEAAIASGRAYPHETVSKWLNTWGQPDQKPFKEWLADQDG